MHTVIWCRSIAFCRTLKGGSCERSVKKGGNTGIELVLWKKYFPRDVFYCKKTLQLSPGDMILEVKFDEFLPEIIACLLQTEGIRQQAFSKYGACRKFG